MSRRWFGTQESRHGYRLGEEDRTGRLVVAICWECGTDHHRRLTACRRCGAVLWTPAPPAERATNPWRPAPAAQEVPGTAGSGKVHVDVWPTTAPVWQQRFPDMSGFDWTAGHAESADWSSGTSTSPADWGSATHAGSDAGAGTVGEPEPLSATTAAGPVDPVSHAAAATEVELTNVATAEAESDAVEAEPEPEQHNATETGMPPALARWLLLSATLGERRRTEARLRPMLAQLLIGMALSGASATPRAIDFANSLGGLILTLCRFQVAVSPGVQRESGALEVALARSSEHTKQVTHRIDFAGIAGPCMALSMIRIPIHNSVGQRIG